MASGSRNPGSFAAPRRHSAPGPDYSHRGAIPCDAPIDLPPAADLAGCKPSGELPGWGLRAERVARWDRFSHPDPLPAYSDGFPTVWWWDADKAKQVGASK